MGCRICIEAPLDATMPLDFTVLLRSTPPRSASFAPYATLIDCTNGMIVDTQPPYACRRVATFPLVNNQRTPKPSNLKYRSLSESTDLRALTFDKFNQDVDLSEEKCLLIRRDSDNEERASDYCDRDIDSSVICVISLKSISPTDNRLPSTDETVTDNVINVIDSKDDKMIKLNDPVATDKAMTVSDLITINERSRKKKVAFADDRGLELTTIRVMTEASDVPPKINYSAIMKGLLGEDWADDETVAKPCATWLINFKQPASEYMAFRQKLDANYVAVENVLVKNDQCRLVGTAKVKNICYDKEVFVRFTDNEWKSYFDRPCKFVSTRGSTQNAQGVNDSYDTFQFDFEIPCDSSQHQRMEFCLCYKTGDSREFWDNNEGKNFEIISEHLRSQRCQTQTLTQTPLANQTTHTDANGLEAANLNWTEFASWSDLGDSGDAYW